MTKLSYKCILHCSFATNTFYYYRFRWYGP